ncbi:hypothetical protein A3726_07505 [Erythrobacter sp. HI0037]|nr:hypothetical protein CHH26_04500 [Qipengyuania flava]KZX88616.1 hypothetical protein A3719_06580 [Erythrobacter sp. HI0020]KZY20788.1 hypothetical protein A3726_07505 [Erythrobacter sp. HI0037]KZY21129.1 hypothetical protein A3727_13240 [Erythrobacter sp. HI0038]MEC8836945.1 hypothetical protein [Pseudomonadota bacterium]
MFVMAALVTGHTRETVKVRNMSASGALVEGSTLPHPGTQCLLNRGEIALEAEVVWMKFGKAGLRFAQRADVAQWLPSGRRSQSDVDDAVRQAKAAQAAPVPPHSRTVPPQAAPLFATELSREDVGQTAAAIEQLADQLAGDPDVVARYMTKLQSLDIAAQTLRKLAEQMP